MRSARAQGLVWLLLASFATVRIAQAQTGLTGQAAQAEASARLDHILVIVALGGAALGLILSGLSMLMASMASKQGSADAQEFNREIKGMKLDLDRLKEARDTLATEQRSLKKHVADELRGTGESRRSMLASPTAPSGGHRTPPERTSSDRTLPERPVVGPALPDVPGGIFRTERADRASAPSLPEVDDAPSSSPPARGPTIIRPTLRRHNDDPFEEEAPWSADLPKGAARQDAADLVARFARDVAGSRSDPDGFRRAFDLVPLAAASSSGRFLVQADQVVSYVWGSRPGPGGVAYLVPGLESVRQWSALMKYNGSGAAERFNDAFELEADDSRELRLLSPAEAEVIGGSEYRVIRKGRLSGIQG